MAGKAHPGRPVKLIVRPLEAGDAQAAVRITRLCAETAVWPEESYTRLGEAGYRGWVAEAGGEIAGFLVARGAADEAEILNLAVAPEFRRRGYGSKLAAEALREFRRQEIRRVFLEVRESNRAGIRFYGRLGFRVTGRRSAYYEVPREDALCMTLGLAP